MKKICILTSVHSALDIRIFHKEAKTLANADYSVVLIAQHNKEEIISGIKIIPLSRPKNRFCRIFFLTKKVYGLALEQKADIYHFHDPEFLPWAVKLKRKTGAKIIYDVHENVPKQILSKYWIPNILKGFIALLVNVLEKFYARKMDRIIVATENISERFPREKTEVIRNFPDFSKINNILPIDYNKKLPIVLYQGGIVEIRGIRQIVAAAGTLKEKIELWLIGSFSPANFRKEILTKKTEAYIKYKGYLPFEKMCRFLKRADIGLVLFLPEPNHIESLPNKIFEYMAAGIPVIASNFPLWKNIIEENKCGICVNPLEPKEIVKAIEYLIKYPEKAKEMGKNGKKAVLEKYNWENESRKLLKNYEKLVER
ncbi:MAG: glycosyltransferase family 4 protein [Candidatus Paceibacterota bacterium]|jgi:glycosyltransferase involved in cell wall biosynthesis